jgi:hypothetical protein
MSGYLAWAEATLAHASTRNAAITLTAKRLFMLIELLKDLKNLLPIGKTGGPGGRCRTIGTAEYSG